MYEKEGYVRMGEGEGGEYEPQKGYQYMRRPESRMAQGETGEEVHIIECGSSNSVPREAWMWMEEQIRDGDGATRKQVQSILRPREEVMKYAIAVLRDVERRDGMGRSRRVTRMLSCRETREYTQSNVKVM